MKIVYSVLDDLPNSEIANFFAFDYRTGWFPIKYTMLHYLEFNDINLLLNKLSEYDFDAACIQSSYYCPFNIDIYHSSLLNMIKDEEFLVAGHIIDNEELFFQENQKHNKIPLYFSLHNQCFLVNLNKYRELNCPIFTLDVSTALLPFPKRSSVNAHDNYTPLRLDPTDQKSNYNLVGIGNNFIKISLENNLSVLNFTEEIRKNKFYVYPGEADDFVNMLKFDENKNLRNSSLNYVKYNKNPSNEKFYIFNTEPYHEFNHPKPNLDFLVCPCSGLKANMFLYQIGFTSETTIVHFDLSKLAIESTNKMLNMSGEEVCNFLENQNEFKFNELVKFFDNTLIQHWEDYKKCKHEFLNLDVVLEYEKLYKYFLGNSLFWFSNCFYYKSTYLNYGGYKIMTPRIINMFDNLNQINPDLWLDGLILAGSDLPSRIITGFAKDVSNEFRSTNIIQEKFNQSFS